MNPRRSTQPAIEPITLAQAKLHLRVDDNTAEDAYITTLIQVARETCENRIQRTLINTGWTLSLDTFPDAIRLSMTPIVSVSSVSYRDILGDTQVLSALDYEVDTANDPGYIVPAYLTTWPVTYTGINSVTIVYTAGYGATAASVPASIKQWLLLAIGDMYANRERSADKPVIEQCFADGLLDAHKVWGA
jgi:uncharacterized phiE125 gp8 family phage protein